MCKDNDNDKNLCADVTIETSKIEVDTKVSGNWLFKLIRFIGRIIKIF